MTLIRERLRNIFIFLLVFFTLFTRTRAFMIELMDVKVQECWIWAAQAICLRWTSTSPTSWMATQANSVVQFIHCRVVALRAGKETLKMSACIKLEGFNGTFCHAEVICSVHCGVHSRTNLYAFSRGRITEHAFRTFGNARKTWQKVVWAHTSNARC